MNVITLEDNEAFYQGPFWIIAESMVEMLRGNFQIVGEKYESNYSGSYRDDSIAKHQKNHKAVWKKFASDFSQVDWNFYPRGKVSIYRGVAFIHLDSRCNVPKVVDKVVEEYHLQKLELEIDLNDIYQGSYYNFQLE